MSWPVFPISQGPLAICYTHSYININQMQKNKIKNIPKLILSLLRVNDENIFAS